MAEDHRFIVAQFLTLVINNDDEAVVLILQGDPQMGIEQREAVLKILAQGSIFGRIDFIEGDVIKGNILIEQGRNGVDDVRDATAIDNGKISPTVNAIKNTSPYKPDNLRNNLIPSLYTKLFAKYISKRKKLLCFTKQAESLPAFCTKQIFLCQNKQKCS